VAHTDCKLRAGNEVNNGTGGQRHGFIAGKPCGFNTIGGVTGTSRAFQSRTKEQGARVGRTLGVQGTRVPKKDPGYKHRTLPELEGLLE
jgi:hypothetical protein